MSSAVPARTDRPAASAALAADAVMTEPKALNKMLGSDRPMAWLIIRVSSVPEAPTSVPATMSRLLSSVNPEAATARPVKALSREMSTGTSAPPMGSTKIDPEDQRQDQHDHEHSGAGRDDGDHEQGHDGQADDRVDGLLGRVGDGPSRHELLQLGEGDRAAREGHRHRRGRRRGSRRSCRRRWDLPPREMNSVSDTSAAAPPPTPLKMATICGIAVIFTSARRGHPDDRTDDDGDDDEHEVRGCGAVDLGQGEGPPPPPRACPSPPARLPRRASLGRAQALEGEDEPDDGDEVDEVGGGGAAHDAVPEPPPSGVAPELGARRPGSAAGALRSVGFALNMCEHPVGDDEAADDVQGGQYDGEEARGSAGRRRAPRPGRSWCRPG